MAELKTQRTTASATDFINTIEPEQKRQDSFTILKMMQEITGEQPILWSNVISPIIHRFGYELGIWPTYPGAMRPLLTHFTDLALGQK